MGGMDAATMKQFVRGLSIRDRQLLMLHWAEQLTPTEIELVLDLPEGFARRALDDLKRRARRLLLAHGLIREAQPTVA
jgi:DNA-directed RNA polymerase specialized sigma24 family protein